LAWKLSEIQLKKKINKGEYMGLFTNPLGYAGYPPGVTGTPETQNTTVRAATLTEVAAGVLDNCYVSPLTFGGSVAVDFASPPALGFGSTTPRPVHATTLDSTSTTSLATAVGATSVNVANAANTGALVTNINSGASGANSTVNILAGNGTAGTQTLNALTGTRAGVANIGTGAAAHTLNLLSSTGLLGTFGATAVVQQTQGAITNSVTSGGSTGTIANYTDLTVYANDSAAIRNDIYQLALGLQGTIAALRAYGLCK